MSKRAREAAIRREDAKLFPPGFWDLPAPTPRETARADALAMRRRAATLRELAGRGMCVRKYAREATMLEAEADRLEVGDGLTT
jgi:hypothetical protein